MARKKKQPEAPTPDPLPFSLVCSECDSGQEITSQGEAELEGWRDIEADSTGLFWNHVGICYECQLREAQEELDRRAKLTPLFKD